MQSLPSLLAANFVINVGGFCHVGTVGGYHNLVGKDSEVYFPHVMGVGSTHVVCDLHSFGLLLQLTIFCTFWGLQQMKLWFCKPFVAAGVFLGRLGTIIFTVLQLSLRALYYIIVLWLLVYILNLLYYFVQHRDFALQGEFYFGPSPHHDHFGQGQQTLTITPVLLDQ